MFSITSHFPLFIKSLKMFFGFLKKILIYNQFKKCIAQWARTVFWPTLVTLIYDCVHFSKECVAFHHLPPWDFSFGFLSVFCFLAIISLLLNHNSFYLNPYLSISFGTPTNSKLVLFKTLQTHITCHDMRLVCDRVSKDEVCSGKPCSRYGGVLE